jgi:hypothetical protein
MKATIQIDGTIFAVDAIACITPLRECPDRGTLVFEVDLIGGQVHEFFTASRANVSEKQCIEETRQMYFRAIEQWTQAKEFDTAARRV